MPILLQQSHRQCLKSPCTRRTGPREHLHMPESPTVVPVRFLEVCSTIYPGCTCTIGWLIKPTLERWVHMAFISRYRTPFASRLVVTGLKLIRWRTPNHVLRWRKMTIRDSWEEATHTLDYLAIFWKSDGNKGVLLSTLWLQGFVSRQWCTIKDFQHAVQMEGVS